MEAQTPVTPSTEQESILQTRQILESTMRGGINWFYWIGALSIINTLLYFFGADITFVVGLGITQIVDGFIYAAVLETGATGITVLHIFGLFVNFVIAGIFILFGYLGRRLNRWAVIVGIVLYTLDGLLFLLFADWMPVIWHALGLFFLWRGLRALNKLIAMDKPAPATIGALS